MAREGLILPVGASRSGRCALCEAPFKLGDAITQVWPKAKYGATVSAGLTLHQGCFRQLDGGDLTKLFAGLRVRLGRPLGLLGVTPWAGASFGASDEVGKEAMRRAEGGGA